MIKWSGFSEKLLWLLYKSESKMQHLIFQICKTSHHIWESENNWEHKTCGLGQQTEITGGRINSWEFAWQTWEKSFLMRGAGSGGEPNLVLGTWQVRPTGRTPIWIQTLIGWFLVWMLKEPQADNLRHWGFLKNTHILSNPANTKISSWWPILRHCGWVDYRK